MAIFKEITENERVNERNGRNHPFVKNDNCTNIEG